MYLEGGAGGIIGTSASSLLISFVRILGIGFNMVFFVWLTKLSEEELGKLSLKAAEQKNSKEKPRHYVKIKK